MESFKIDRSDDACSPMVCVVRLSLFFLFQLRSNQLLFDIQCPSSDEIQCMHKYTAFNLLKNCSTKPSSNEGERNRGLAGCSGLEVAHFLLRVFAKRWVRRSLRISLTKKRSVGSGHWP